MEFCGPRGFGPVQQDNGLLAPCFVTMVLYLPLYVLMIVGGIWETATVLVQKQYQDPAYVRNLWTVIFSALLIIFSIVQLILHLLTPPWYPYMIFDDSLKICAWGIHLITQASQMSRFLPSNRTVIMFQVLIFIPATIEAYSVGQHMYGMRDYEEDVFFYLRYAFVVCTTIRGLFNNFFDFGRRILRPQDLVFNSLKDKDGGETSSLIGVADQEGRLLCAGECSSRINEMRFFENWAGNIEMFPKRLYEPTSVDEIIEIVKMAGEERRIVKVIGSAHSDTEIISTNGYLLSLQKMEEILSVEPLSINEYAVTVQAGKNLKALYQELLRREPPLCMPVMGDIAEQSIGGATGTGTHGSGSGYSSISEYIVAMKLVDGNGTIVELNENRPGDADVLKAARVSFGSIGIVYEITIKCLKNYNLQQTKQAANVEHVLDNLKEYLRENEHFEFYWFPHTETCQVIQRSKTNQTDRPNACKRFWSWYANNFILLYLHRLANSWPYLTIPTNKFQTLFLNENSEKLPTDEIQSGAVHIERFTEMEIAVPFETANGRQNGMEAVRAVMNLTKIALTWEKRYYSNQVMSIRFSKADTSYLSPLYLPVVPEKDSQDSWKPDFVWISFNAYDDVESFKPFFEAARDLLLTKHHGRPHWGKQCYLTAYGRLQCFSEYKKFSEIRLRYDPQGLFLNQYLKDGFRE